MSPNFGAMGGQPVAEETASSPGTSPGQQLEKCSKCGVNPTTSTFRNKKYCESCLVEIKQDEQNKRDQAGKKADADAKIIGKIGGLEQEVTTIKASQHSITTELRGIKEKLEKSEPTFDSDAFVAFVKSISPNDVPSASPIIKFLQQKNRRTAAPLELAALIRAYFGGVNGRNQKDNTKPA